MGCSRKPMNSLFSVMLRLLSSSSPTKASSMSSAAVPAASFRGRLGQLGIKELDQLENVLDTSLKEIRSNKSHRMLNQLSDLQTKERNLLEINRALRSKLEGTSTAALQSTWQLQAEHNVQYQQPPPVLPDMFFEPLQSNNIRYNSVQPNNVAEATQTPNMVLPGWMH
ncbi:Agamous-like MADS-box protein [Sesamum angolense]|uniref:Agamous-like MADS-box protein n=1 Tax=Sesamum angolense TaxID=2727404 RepID=A0AAE1WUW1_9LAMI|nr:Agamous-like MADS-box protein [Sesamum angolense]